MDGQDRQPNRERKRSYEIKDEPEELETSPAKRNYIVVSLDQFCLGPKPVTRLDFTNEIRELNVPEKKKDELLEFDDRTRMLRIVNAFSEEQVDR